MTLQAILSILGRVPRWFWILVVGIIIGVVIGWKSHPAPQIKTGVVHDSIQVIVHDTLTLPAQVRMRLRVDTFYRVQHDTERIATRVLDTVPCYSIDTTMPDRAYVRAEMCSREFPRRKPLDLSGLITYRSAPDTQRIQLRIDTVSRSDGFWTKAGRYSVGALAGVVATSAALLILKH